MINVLNISGVQLWIYVDDITVSETVEKNQPNKIQDAVDELSNKSKANKSQPIVKLNVKNSGLVSPSLIKYSILLKLMTPILK